MTNPFDRIKALETRLKAAHEKIADLEYQLSEAIGKDEQAMALMAKHSLTRQEAQFLLLLAMSKGRPLSHGFLVNHSRGAGVKTDIPFQKITNVVVCRLRRRGFEIDTLWGQGYRMNQEQSMKVLEDAKNI